MQLGALQKIFKVAVEVELELSKFYQLISTKLGDSEWIRFWVMMESEEQNHAHMLKMQQRILTSRKLESESNLDVSGLEAILDEIKKINAQWKNEKISSSDSHAGLSPLGAIEKSIDLEKLVRKVHSDQIVTVEDADAKSLFKQLAEQDILHVKRLKEYRKKLK
jgi:rubrerythrin